MRKMPFEAVMRMALVGRHERMSAERALQLGMISQIVDPPEKLREEAQALAEKIARNSPAAMRGDQAGAVGGARERAHRRLPRRRARSRSMWGHPDQEEGPRAFAEKRDAEWLPLDAEKTARHRTGPALMASLLDLLDERPGDAETIAVYARTEEVTAGGLRAAAEDLAATLHGGGREAGPAGRRSCSRTGPRSSPRCSASGTRARCTCRSTRA